jgi:ABC-type nickel/cobalt efflux system permease component RcnA
MVGGLFYFVLVLPRAQISKICSNSLPPRHRHTDTQTHHGHTDTHTQRDTHKHTHTMDASWLSVDRIISVLKRKYAKSVP